MADSRDAHRAAGAGLRFWLALICAAALLPGCFGGPEGVPPPDWDPEGMADAAMKLADKNGDGILDEQELAAAPGLKAAAEAEGGSADTNNDGRLTRDEIRDRIAYYEETATGYEIAAMEFHLGRQGNPVRGATVQLVPEPFLAGVLEEATGTTRDDGYVMVTIPGLGFDAARPGMYRIKVTHPSVPIPAKYNENTTLGIELVKRQEGYSPGPPVFVLEKN